MAETRSSLSLEFSFFSLLSFIAICALSALFGMQVYNDEIEKKNDRLAADAARIEIILSDWMDATGQYAAFIGAKITQLKNPQDLSAIADLITGKLHDERIEAKNSYVTTTFDWVTPDKMLRVSSPIGILGRPLDMSDRDYLQRTMHHAWILQLSAPRIGGISRQWIIPAGLGISDTQGKFLGSVTFGFAIAGLTERLNQLMDNDSHMRYLILSAGHEIILDSQSAESIPSQTDPVPFDALPKKPGHRHLGEPILFREGLFSHYRAMDKYPFIVLTGYHKNMPYAVFTETMFPRLVGLVFVPLFVLIMLLWMRNRFIKPVEQLADMADRVSQGQEVALPRSQVKEIVSLSRQLKKLSDYAQREHRIATELSSKTLLLQQKTAELEQVSQHALSARDMAVQANRAKSEFLANMSHELRTPLNAVIGLTNIMLKKEYSPERQKEFLRTMHVSADQLLALINDLLDLAKLETQNVELESIPFDLNAVIAEVACVNQVMACNKGLDFIVRECKTLPAQVIGDPLRIRQILLNLAGNAVKFTQHGAVSIDVRAQPPQGGKVDLEISVSDTGIGIEKEKLPLIFEKFSQADASTTRSFGGTGLGLAISNTLAKLMNGAIRAESTPGKGSVFTLCLSLPFINSRAEKTGQENRFLADGQVQALRNAVILIVEDNPANIMVATSLLDELGCKHVIAGNGLEAISMVKNRRFDIILMDIQMPRMDGFESTRHIRAYERERSLPPTPIIGVTAHALTQERQQGIQAGMNDYLAKPYSIDALVLMLKKYLCEIPAGRVVAA